MNEFNIRTTLNHRLRQDALTTEARSRAARAHIAARKRTTAFRSHVRTVAVDAAMVGVILMAVVTLVACAVS